MRTVQAVGRRDRRWPAARVLVPVGHHADQPGRLVRAHRAGDLPDPGARLQPAFAGLVIGLWGAGGAVGTLVGGVLADRWGRKPTFLTALYGGAGDDAGVGFARGRSRSRVAVFVLGMVSEASRPAMQALMIDIVPERDRMRAFSLNYWVINLGFAFAATPAGLVAGVDFRLLFVLDAATTVAAAADPSVAIRESREPVPAPPGRAAGRPPTRTQAGWRAVFARPGVHGLRRRQPADRARLHAAHLDAADGDEPGRAVAVDLRHGDRAQRRAHRGRAAVRAAAAAPVRPVHRAGRRGACVLGARLRAERVRRHRRGSTRWPCWSGPSARCSTRRPTRPPTPSCPRPMRGRYQGVFSLSWSAASFVAPILGARRAAVRGPG